MSIINNVKKTVGVATVQIEGFFTERFINLCKINNIKIWDVRNVVKGMIRFKISIYDFKKLRKISKKTKCKIIVKNKKGIYFTLFKYRKRKIVFLLIFLLFFAAIFSSTFIWTIDITGNNRISNEIVIENLKESGLYIGKNRIGIDKKEVITNYRVNDSEVSWIGIQIEGTKAKVEIVEKIVLDGSMKQRTELGNIVASKSGLITKIVPENGTAAYKIGSYIEEGSVAIEGAVYGKYMDPLKVSPKGSVRVNCMYIYENEYKYKEIIKNYINNERYTIGLTINSKENIINYLNKSKKYDITKESKELNIFNQLVSFDLYKFSEYNEVETIKNKENLVEKSNQDVEEYLKNKILPNTMFGNLVDQVTEITEFENGIKVKTIYTINEEVGKFVEGEPQIREKSND